MAESGDFVMIFPSEVIAQVMERYFNQEMLKFPVKVVDVKSSGDDFVFSLGYQKVQEKLVENQLNGYGDLVERELSEIGIQKPKVVKKKVG